MGQSCLRGQSPPDGENMTYNSGTEKTLAAGKSDGFDKLLKTSVPHVLEKIFFSLDYESFKNSKKVCKAWNSVLTSEPFQKKALSQYFYKIQQDKWKGITKLSPELLNDNEQDLCEASFHGQKNVVHELLSYGVNPNCQRCIGKRVSQYTPICLAAEGRHHDVVALLIDAGADPNKGGADTPLNRCILSGDFDTCKLLIQAGANVNTESNGWTPLHCCKYIFRDEVTEDDRLKFMKKLLEEGADPDHSDENGYTEIHSLCSSEYPNNGDPMALAMLLNAGANPNMRDKQGRTPLCITADHFREDRVKRMHTFLAKLLLEAGAQCYHGENGQCYQEIKSYCGRWSETWLARLP